MKTSLSVAVLVACAAGTATAQGPFGQPPSGFIVENPVLRRIWSLGMDSSQASRFAQVLLDSIGPRLTASPGIEAGQDWLVRTYEQLGISARKDRYGTWRGWRRGRSHLDLLQPRVRSLEAMILAWSPGTNGQTVRGQVVTLPTGDSAAFSSWLGTVSGKVVLVSNPQPTCRPDNSWTEHGTQQTVDRMRAARTAGNQSWVQRLQSLGVGGPGGASRLVARLEQAGAIGVLQSNWSNGWGVQKIFGTSAQRVPVFDVSCEDYGLLWRLAEHNQGPVVDLMAESEFLGEVPVFNVLGEIRGRELPNEYVMLSAHFDTWDGSSGATDNGTGTVIMMEAMRLLRAAYPAPRRTILVGHWSGEEQGLNGSRAFAAENPGVVEGLQALFNQDNGTGRVQNISAAGLVGAVPYLARWLSQVPADITRNITFGFTGSPSGGGSDNASFICSGAPGFSLGSGSWDYGTYTWHTNRDTYDKISWEDVKNNAVLTAMLVYLASEERERVPRDRRSVMAPQGPGQTPSQWPSCQPGQRSTPAN